MVTILDAKAEDTILIQSCLGQRPFAWQKFVDRYLPIVLQTIHDIDTQSNRGWTESKHHELARNVFERIKQEECKLLGDWEPSNDFETWLIIVARRIVIASALQTDG